MITLYIAIFSVIILKYKPGGETICTPPHLKWNCFTKSFKIMSVAEILPHCLSPLAFVSESYAVHDHERLAHGRQLKIFLSKTAEKLEFTPADDPSKTLLYWEKGRGRSETIMDTPRSGCGHDGHGGKLWVVSSVVVADVTQSDYLSVLYRIPKGWVSDKGSDQRWYIDKVTKDICFQGNTVNC